MALWETLAFWLSNQPAFASLEGTYIDSVSDLSWNTEKGRLCRIGCGKLDLYFIFNRKFSEQRMLDGRHDGTMQVVDNFQQFDEKLYQLKILENGKVREKTWTGCSATSCSDRS